MTLSCKNRKNRNIKAVLIMSQKILRLGVKKDDYFFQKMTIIFLSYIDPSYVSPLGFDKLSAVASYKRTLLIMSRWTVLSITAYHEWRNGAPPTEWPQNMTILRRLTGRQYSYYLSTVSLAFTFSFTSQV